MHCSALHLESKAFKQSTVSYTWLVEANPHPAKDPASQKQPVNATTLPLVLCAWTVTYSCKLKEG